MRFPPVLAHAALVSALAEALSLWSPGMDMAQPYTLGAAAYANIAIGRSRCPAASKALHGLSTWRASRSTRSEEHTSELQSLMRISYAVFCLKQKKIYTKQ